MVPNRDTGEESGLKFVHLDPDGGFSVDPAILATPGYRRQIEGARMLSKMHKESTETTASRLQTPQPAADADGTSGNIGEGGRAEVIDTRCGCHPETCCHGDYTLTIDGKEVSKGGKEWMQKISDAINSRPAAAAVPVVDYAMVERMGYSFHGADWTWWAESQKEIARPRLRAALAAALTPRTEP